MQIMSRNQGNDLGYSKNAKDSAIRSQVLLKKLKKYSIYYIMGVVYKITCVSNNKIYIGQTKYSSRHRWNQHVYEAKNPKVKQCRLLNRCINKYGKDSFIIEDLIESDIHDELDEWEIFYIDWFKTINTDFGLNLNSGGKKNHIISEETRLYLSNAVKGKPKYITHPRKNIKYNFLPKYLKYYKDSKGIEGFKISDHPNLIKQKKNASISFAKSDMSMSKKLFLAIVTLHELNNNRYKLNIKQEVVGITKMNNGYRVRIKGYPVKTFQKKNLSMDDKYNLAIEYLNNNIKSMQLND
jgi:hypothetical protein